jgi:hypothetical protein
MPRPRLAHAPALVVALALAAGVAAVVHAQTPPSPGTPMTATARGPFDVKLTPQAAPGTTPDPTAVGRMTLDKTFHGDLEGTSAGEMLAVRTAEPSSAGYVALERVTGTLAGRKGTFALQHSGLMNKGRPDLTIVIVPDSGTDGLTGIAGKMTIEIAPGGKHSYELIYTLPPPAAK